MINNYDVLYSDPNIISELFNNDCIDMTKSNDDNLNINPLNIPFHNRAIFLIPTNDTEV